MTTGFTARDSQLKRIEERRAAPTVCTTISGLDFDILSNVYDTSMDTALMCGVVKVLPHQTFVEVGCGCGAIAIHLARRAASGVATDINPDAIRNTQHNASKHRVTNLTLHCTDVLDDVDGRFDVIVCNPPYNAYPANDAVEAMFWDDQNRMKKKFFAQCIKHMKSSTQVYFGWANFVDLDPQLPFTLAQAVGLHLQHTYSRASHGGRYINYVYQFSRSS